MKEEIGFTLTQIDSLLSLTKDIDLFIELFDLDGSLLTREDEESIARNSKENSLIGIYKEF